MILLCVDICIEQMLPGKTLLVYTNSFSPNDYKKNDKKYISILRTNMSSLKFRFKKIDETRNILLDEKKRNIMN